MTGRKDDVTTCNVNLLRVRLIEVLDAYNRLCARMAEYENMFLTLVILPGLQLRQSIKKRETLEHEHSRIRENIIKGAYSSSEEIEEDIRAVLRNAEVEHFYEELEEAADELKSKGPTAGFEVFDPEEQPDEKERARILREFKRIVMPRIHADTSDTPFEVFNTVYAAYKKRDFLLMRAFIIQYGGECARRPMESDESFTERAAGLLLEYQTVLERLERRMRRLEDNMTAKEIESQETVLRQLRTQNKEIQRAVYEEAERILHVRSLLERLASETRKVH